MLPRLDPPMKEWGAPLDNILSKLGNEMIVREGTTKNNDTVGLDFWLAYSCRQESFSAEFSQ